MISELNLIWQEEEMIEALLEKASKSTQNEAEEYIKQVDFLREQIKIIKSQPRWDAWNLVNEKDPLVDGRYLVYQKYLDDGYKEVTTAVFKKGKWCISTGEYNEKYSSYTLRRQILAWAPLQSPPIFDEIEVEQFLLERKEDNEQMLV